jgi:hypothetical protein
MIHVFVRCRVTEPCVQTQCDVTLVHTNLRKNSPLYLKGRPCGDPSDHRLSVSKLNTNVNNFVKTPLYKQKQ